jgi:hypothetical protein
MKGDATPTASIQLVEIGWAYSIDIDIGSEKARDEFVHIYEKSDCNHRLLNLERSRF